MKLLDLCTMDASVLKKRAQFREQSLIGGVKGNLASNSFGQECCKLQRSTLQTERIRAETNILWLQKGTVHSINKNFNAEQFLIYGHLCTAIGCFERTSNSVFEETR